MDAKRGLKLLFQRPLEPLFTPRDNGKAIFDVPESFFTDRFKGSAADIESRFGNEVEEKIPLRDIPPPDLSVTKAVAEAQQFSLFNDNHKKAASGLIKLFLDAVDINVFLSVAAYAKDRCNPALFQYALSVAIQHREDTKNESIPTIVEIFPANFVDPSTLRRGRTEGSIIIEPNQRRRIEIPQNFTASPREEEQRIAYFREDIGVNMHHWHWHLVYPTEGPDVVVNKDRRGELFYYMHHQIQARYNVERFTHGLAKVKPLNNFREPIPEGYYPKILSSITNRTYPGRKPNSVLKDCDRPGAVVEIADLERWQDRIHAAIDQGFVVDVSGNRIPLDPVRGIDILGNLIEASQLSINPNLYGNLHNMGHNTLSYIHDPDGRYKEDFAVLADVTTAMRDPAFYRLHQMVDLIFVKFKNTLEPYVPNELGYNGINVSGVQVKVNVGRSPAPNFLLTYWQQSDVDLGSALDFGPNGDILASYQHLQHAPFHYQIEVTNSTGGVKMGTCRIFLCPRADERGTTLSYNDRRLLAIELDKFTVTLKPNQNTIIRQSVESNITIPYERTFRRVGVRDQPTAGDQLAEFQFCGCGWPQHMLLPKSNEVGIEFDLFVMISNFDDDLVVQPFNAPDVCGDASSFCGLKNKLYPDKRGMGYPFDRRHTINTLEEFVNANSNMVLQPIRIKFNNEVIERV